MTLNEALTLFRTEDLTAIGLLADARRRQLYPDGIVTYSAAKDAGMAVRVSLENEPDQALAELEAAWLAGAAAIVPVCSRPRTAAEYLRFLAVSRLYTPGAHIELDAEWSGLKVAQIALRFGADDFGNVKPSGPVPEEEIRRTIREAGFIPKRRDREYRSLSLY